MQHSPGFQHMDSADVLI